MEILSLFFLAFAVSMDSFSVGFTYGLRKMRIPFHGCFILAICSGTILYFSILIGSSLSGLLSEKASQTIGGMILIFLGVWALGQFFLGHKNLSQKEAQTEKILLKFEVKTIGLVIKKPITADLDHSGTITGIEAVLLGIALSVDAFGAGIGASMLGFSPLLLACMVGTMSAIFAYFGIHLGSKLASEKWMKKFSFLPGILLICFGIWRL